MLLLVLGMFCVRATGVLYGHSFLPFFLLLLLVLVFVTCLFVLCCFVLFCFVLF